MCHKVLKYFSVPKHFSKCLGVLFCDFIAANHELQPAVSRFGKCLRLYISYKHCLLGRNFRISAQLRMMIVVFWVVTSCGVVGGYQSFGVTLVSICRRHGPEEQCRHLQHRENLKSLMYKCFTYVLTIVSLQIGYSEIAVLIGVYISLTFWIVLRLICVFGCRCIYA
jgi:hypothetical protein